MTKGWGEIGREAAKKLEGMTDENAIALLGRDLIAQILERESDNSKRVNAHKQISRAIRDVHPNKDSEHPLYWHDPRGKQSLPKWRHLIFKTFTFSSEGWGTAEYKAKQAEADRPTEEPTKEPAEAPIEQPNTTIMNQLKLDADTQKALNAALEATGMEIMELIRRAIASYSKSIANKHAITIATIPTKDLLDKAEYSTLPGRGEELTKRAIRAIMKHNNEVATGAKDSPRWAITQSIIASLIGARPANVGKAMKPYQAMIEEHNIKHEVTGYTNRGNKISIESAIDLAALCPNGLD